MTWLARKKYFHHRRGRFFHWLTEEYDADLLWVGDDPVGSSVATNLAGVDGVYEGDVTLGVPGIVRAYQSGAFVQSHGHARFEGPWQHGEGGYTIFFWAKPVGVGSFRSIIATKNDTEKGFRISHTAGGDIIFRLSDGASNISSVSTSSSPLENGKETFVLIAVDASNTARIYIDGELDEIGSVASAEYTGDDFGELHVGTRPSQSQSYQGTLQGLGRLPKTIGQSQARRIYQFSQGRAVDPIPPPINIRAIPMGTSEAEATLLAIALPTVEILGESQITRAILKEPVPTFFVSATATGGSSLSGNVLQQRNFDVEIFGSGSVDVGILRGEITTNTEITGVGAVEADLFRPTPVREVSAQLIGASQVSADLDAPLTPQFGYTISDISTGDWSNTPLWPKVADEDLNVFIQSENNTDPDTCELRIEELGPPSSNEDHSFTVSYRKSEVGGHDITFQATLVNADGSIIKTHSDNYDSTTWKTETIDLSAAEAAEIQDYSNIRIRFTRLGDSGGGPDTRRRYMAGWFELQVPPYIPQEFLVSAQPTGVASVDAKLTDVFMVSSTSAGAAEITRARLTDALTFLVSATATGGSDASAAQPTTVKEATATATGVATGSANAALTYMVSATATGRGEAGAATPEVFEGGPFDSARTLNGMLGFVQMDYPEYGGQTVMWQDMDRTQPVTTAGQKVAYIDDINGQGFDLFQPNIDRRPEWRGNGLGCDFGTSTNTHFFVSSAAFSTSLIDKMMHGGFTMGGAANLNGRTDLVEFFGIRNASGNQQYWRIHINAVEPSRAVNLLRAESWSSAWSQSTSNWWPTNEKFVFAQRMDGGGSKTYMLNPNQTASRTDAPHTSGSVVSWEHDPSVGSWNRDGAATWSNWQETIHCVFFMDGALSNSDFENVIVDDLLVLEDTDDPPEPDGQFGGTLAITDLYMFHQFDYAVYEGQTVLWQDDAMTNPVTTAGQSVAVAEDLTGNGRHLFQPTASLRPVWQGEGNGCLFDDSHWFWIDQSHFPTSLLEKMILGQSTIGYAGHLNNEGSWDSVFFGFDHDNDGLRWRVTTNVIDPGRTQWNIRTANNNSFDDVASWNNPTNARFVNAYRHNGGGSVDFMRNPSEITNRTTAPTSGTITSLEFDLTVGVWQRFGGQNFGGWPGVIHAFFIVENNITNSTFQNTIVPELMGE